jgi:hypothetical protein
MREVLKYYMNVPLLASKRFDVADSLILCSEARGGSTWLMELLSHLPGSLVNWEPLHPEHGLIPPALGWSKRPYLPKDLVSPAYRKMMEEVLTYQRHSSWTFLRAGWTDTYRARFVITKFVRAIPLLPWLLRQFDFRHPPILLLRHPVDTCLSMMKAFGTPKNDNGSLRLPERIQTRYPHEQSFLQQLSDPLEHRVAIWCLDNLPTLNDELVQQKAVWIYYEDLLLQPEAAMERLLLATGFEAACQAVLEKAAFRQPSPTDFEHQLRKTPEEQLWKNLNRLSKMEKDRIQGIFDRYGLSQYDAYTPLPLDQQLPTGG